MWSCLSSIPKLLCLSFLSCFLFIVRSIKLPCLLLTFSHHNALLKLQRKQKSNGKIKFEQFEKLKVVKICHESASIQRS